MNTKRGTANATCLFMLMLVLMTALLPCKAFADEALGDADTPQAPKTANSQASSSENGESTKVSVSEDATSASIEGTSYSVCDFARAQKGSNRAIDGTYYGYSYLVGNETGEFFSLLPPNPMQLLTFPPKQHRLLASISTTRMI